MRACVSGVRGVAVMPLPLLRAATVRHALRDVNVAIITFSFIDCHY